MSEHWETRNYTDDWFEIGVRIDVAKTLPVDDLIVEAVLRFRGSGVSAPGPSHHWVADGVVPQYKEA